MTIVEDPLLWVHWLRDEFVSASLKNAERQNVVLNDVRIVEFGSDICLALYYEWAEFGVGSGLDLVYIYRVLSDGEIDDHGKEWHTENNVQTIVLDVLLELTESGPAPSTDDAQWIAFDLTLGSAAILWGFDPKQYVEKYLATADASPDLCRSLCSLLREQRSDPTNEVLVSDDDHYVSVILSYGRSGHQVYRCAVHIACPSDMGQYQLVLNAVMELLKIRRK